MYCATSFWDRENSSNRAWMYSDRLWGPASAGSGAAGVVVAERFIGPPSFDVAADASFTLGPSWGRSRPSEALNATRPATPGQLGASWRPIQRDPPEWNRTEGRGWGDMCAEA